MRVNNEDYISLTDLSRYADNEETKIPIQNWMRNKDVISFLGLWEKINNNNFKGVEFDTFKKEAGKTINRIKSIHSLFI
ncbi:MAG: KilA-N domain-containing protein [Bacilli bacterium]|nr:KilA-N domain-containing protein [Bacilli bacterium]